jgi:hypothetical protein
MSVRPTPVPSGLVWFGLLAPPIGWAVQLVVVYLIEEAGCGRPDSSLWGADLGTVSAVMVVVAAVLAVAGGVASLVASRSDEFDDRGLTAFLTTAGLVGAPIFLLAIVLDAVALVPLSGCQAG